MSPAEAWITALLTVSPSLQHRACIRAHLQEIAHQATESAQAHSIPLGLLLSVAVHESHLGCHPASGGCWGAPSSRLHRHRAGNASHAASALALGYRRCRTDEGAIAHFRWGRCHVPAHPHGYGPSSVLRLAERVARAIP